MASISERESREIEAANASGTTPVVFIHGLWLLPSSWANWADFFKQAGYAPLTPDWPDDPETVEEARANPDVLAKKTLKQVADHTADVIGKLEKKPAVMGHSTGRLAGSDARGRGLSAATVAIDPGSLPRRSASAGLRAQGRGPVPDQPRARAAAQSRSPSTSSNTAGRTPSMRTRRSAFTTPTTWPGRGSPSVQMGNAKPQPWDGVEGRHEEPRSGPAADHRRREGPHGAVGDRQRCLQSAERNPSVTEIKKMPNRGHSLTIDHGWQEVAQTALDFVKRFVPAKPS
jgi:pimeloyl-ACP methyl ester carboxylesterase